KLQGLGRVRSSRVRRLARSRKGVFNRPGVPVSVRGFEWESLMLVGSDGRPQVVAMNWWGREPGVQGQQRRVQERLLAKVATQWGCKVRHVFDRGYGTAPWLERLWNYRVRFVVRWKKATSCWMPLARSAKPGRSPGANAPGGPRPTSFGIRIAESIAAPVCWLCRCVIPATQGHYGW